MECALMQQDLIVYQLGEIDDAARARLEAHLASCSLCLQDYFALKRSLDSSDLTPSATAKARLRQDVVRSVTRAQPRRGWAWWERPLAVGLAVGAVTLATLATASLAASPGAAPHGWVADGSR